MKQKAKAENPFRFFTRLNLRELTGKRAHDLRELVETIKKVPGSVIYHHTHHFLQQHQYLSPEPPNDFAYWTREALGEEKLAERLTSIDTRDFPTIRSLREKIIEVIEDHVSKIPKPLRTAPEGQEFHFVKSQSFVFPTPYTAWTLKEFAQILRKVTIGSIYFHVFEARLRLGRPTNDFSFWIETSLGDGALAEGIANIDPYSSTMEGLRESIIRLAEAKISKSKKAG